RWIEREGRRRPTTHRDPPRLVPRPDGSLFYDGPSFDAVIRPDGEVEFSDASALGYDWTQATGTIDPTQLAMEAAGQDPFVYERIRFMEETAEVRERREDEARARRATAALARFRGRLALGWQDDTVDVGSRRRALFEAWDEADEDDPAARAAVIAFVRDNLPAGSTDAFGEMELARLNATRESAAPFDPYGR
ncbi:MAG TPA: hypothetical protein VL400_17765, partial [Polyangiaceae bacterium]|nr:hypothetical protein [Polyangiaceae bacterium]